MSDNKKTPFNIVGKIKHFILDPIKSPEEADARKKELLPYLGISFGAAALFIILGMAIEPIKIVFDILGYLCVGLTLMFGFFMFRAFQLKKKLGNLQCPKCQTIINGDNVTFVVKSCNFRITENKSQNPKAGMDLILHGFEHTTVEITCKCQECGTDKTFTECFKTVDVEISRKGVSALNADLILSQMRADLEIAQKSGFEGVSGDYKFKTKKTAEQMVKDYFADDGTASRIGNTTVTASKK